jgi:hypothetical protein
LQNHQAFEFFDPVIKSGLATYHTAGAFGRGERVWVLVEVAGTMAVAPDDSVKKLRLAKQQP